MTRVARSQPRHYSVSGEPTSTANTSVDNTSVTTTAPIDPAQAGDSTRPIPPEARNRPGEMMVMQYNIENLFDTQDDPHTADEDFTPEGRNHWNERRLSAKMQKLGQVIRHVNGGQGPEVLALQEVENKPVLDRLRKGALRGMGYREPILIEGQDHRGIDVALLTKYPLAGKPKIHDVSDDSWRGKSRPILEVPLDVDGREMTVYVNHWPSKRGGEQAEAERTEAADRLRGLIKQKLARDPDAEIMVVGDFNTDLGESPLREHLKSGGDKEIVRNSTADDPLFFDAIYDAARKKSDPHKPGSSTPVDLTAELASRRTAVATGTAPVRSGDPDETNRVGTHFYGRNKSWSTFDHVILSKGLLDDQGLSYVPGSAQVVHPHFMENRNGSPKRFMPRPRRGRKDRGELPPEQMLGYSDHFPVVARFKRVSPVED